MNRVPTTIGTVPPGCKFTRSDLYSSFFVQICILILHVTLFQSDKRRQGEFPAKSITGDQICLIWLPKHSVLQVNERSCWNWKTVSSVWGFSMKSHDFSRFCRSILQVFQISKIVGTVWTSPVHKLVGVQLKKQELHWLAEFYTKSTLWSDTHRNPYQRRELEKTATKETLQENILRFRNQHLITS